MRDIIKLIAVLAIISFAGCVPQQMGPSFEPTPEGSGIDYGDKIGNASNKYSGSPLLVEDTIFVPAMDGSIFALNSKDGKKLISDQWNFKKLGQGIRCTPAYRDGILYFSAFDKNIHGIDASNGQTRFTFPTGGYNSATPLIIGDILYMGSYDGIFRALDLSANRLKWEFDSGSVIKGGAVQTSNGICFGNLDGVLYHLDRETGSELWKYQSEGEISSCPAYKDNVVIFGNHNGNVIALNSDNASVMWNYKSPPDDRLNYREKFWSNPAVDDTAVYIGSTWGKFYAFKIQPSGSEPEFLWEPFVILNEELVAVDKSTNDLILSEAAFDRSHSLLLNIGYQHPKEAVSLVLPRFKKKTAVLNDVMLIFAEILRYFPFTEVLDNLDGRFYFEYSSGGKVLFGANDYKMYCLDKSTGNLIWEFATMGEVRAKPVVFDNIVAFPSNDHYFYGLNLSDGQPIRMKYNVE